MTAVTAKPYLHPPLLKRGDTIALAAPAGPIGEDLLRQGLQLLRDCGIKKVKYASDICRRDHYLAGSDQRRIEELHQLWDDDEVKAIIAVRGGYGCARLLPRLDFDLIRTKPKILVGFSDLTILLNTISRQTGLVTFHGPMLSTLVRDGRETLEATLNELTVHAQQRLKIKDLEILRPGEAQGLLIGGNLACLAQLLATPYEPAWEGAILLLEEVNEAAYRIDRLLTQLSLAGRLDTLAGIILGDFLDSDGHSINERDLIWQRLLDLTPETIPVWANFPAGHGRRNLLLPIGRTVHIDSSSAALELR
ncbi:MAG: LD-carboxypeptidase [Desulfobulbaceae bacterium]|nr:LD-carboxypeptidase [Desulfobulbaceae bacterium]